MTTLEEIAYEAGRDALASQESAIAGIRQGAGTLVAAHALVASFLGATTVRSADLDLLAWVAIGCLVAALVVAAALLSPWDLRFAVDARTLYSQLDAQAAEETERGTLGWLAEAGFGYRDLHEGNAPRVRWMSRLLRALAILMVAQTVAWLTALGVP